MFTLNRLILATIAIVLIPLELHAGGETHKQYVHCYKDAYLVEEGYGWYYIEQECAYGWLSSDGTFEEDYWEDCGSYDLHDYEDEWDFAQWRAGKYVVVTDHDTTYPGFTKSEPYYYHGSYYACLEPEPPLWDYYWDVAYSYYHAYTDAGYYYHGLAYYYYCTNIGDCYYALSCGDYLGAYRAYNLAYYYYYYYVYYHYPYVRDAHCMPYYYNYSFTYSDEEDWGEEGY